MKVKMGEFLLIMPIKKNTACPHVTFKAWDVFPDLILLLGQPWWTTKTTQSERCPHFRSISLYTVVQAKQISVIIFFFCGGRGGGILERCFHGTHMYSMLTSMCSVVMHTYTYMYIFGGWFTFSMMVLDVIVETSGWLEGLATVGTVYCQFLLRLIINYVIITSSKIPHMFHPPCRTSPSGIWERWHCCPCVCHTLDK